MKNQSTFESYLSFAMIIAGIGSFYWFQGNIDFFKEYVPSLNYYFTPIIVSKSSKITFAKSLKPNKSIVH